ncbi:uncharacterized protein B0H64DRAFT_382388 [Chaetomium fimeti]|uniref:Uncharacterized protein n=1 Tax=Chaetomium fimeti TaxID=1854472 RepID=A0AAE0LXG0_9PEZI|nr:hypothetical protein B0H64DRAFT_382388 [Chaetomium fimeti]
MADNLPSGTEFRAGRSDSTASASSTGSTTGWANVKQQAATTTATAPTTQQAAAAAAARTPASPYRRPSHPLFEGLTAQKRKDDAASVARRQSMSEQRPATGFIGQMWNNWVYGKQ